MKLTGLTKVLNNIERYDKIVATDIDALLSQAAESVKQNAQSLAPRKSGKLVAGITTDTSTKYRKIVTARARYSAYVEFGTGSKVFLGGYAFSQEQKNYARQFYVNGKGHRRSDAFLFPSFSRETPLLIGKIRKVFFG